MEVETCNKFLVAALDLGRLYLSHGGSITNLENSLTQAGQVRGFATSVHATPTGITISCVEARNETQNSLSTRLGPLTTHLGKLIFFERLLLLFSQGAVGSKKLTRLLGKGWTTRAYPRPLIFAAVFLVGFTASYNRTLRLRIAVIGGAITLAAYLMETLFSKFFKSQQTLKDFVLCFAAISLSILASSVLSIHPSQIFIGTLALVLPGLTLTSAIGDLIEENYQTGLVKLAKTSLTLLSIGFSYMLATEWLANLGFINSSLIIAKVDSIPRFFSSLASTLGMILSFCILLKVPRRAVLSCLLIGSLGWIVFGATSSADHPFAASFLAALIISIAARVSARMNNMITQVYIVPSILVLVPGLLAFSYLQPIVDEASVAHASRAVLSSVMIAAALAFGLLIGQLRFHEGTRSSKSISS